MDIKSISNTICGCMVLLTRDIELPTIDNITGVIQDSILKWGYYQVDFYDPEKDEVYLIPEGLQKYCLSGISPNLISIDEHCEKYNRGARYLWLNKKKE